MLEEMNPRTRRLLEEAQQGLRRAIRLGVGNADDNATALGWVTFYLLEGRQPSAEATEKGRRMLAHLRRRLPMES